MSLEAEQHLIGCALIDNESVVKLLEIPEEWFLTNQHKIIHRAFKALTAQNLNTDMFALDDYLKRTTGENDALNIEYLIELSERLPSLNHWGSYKSVLFDSFLKYTLRTFAQNLLNKTNGNEQGTEIVSYVQNEVCKLTENNASGGPQTIGTYLKQLIDQTEWQMNNPGQLRGLKTGFDELDKTINGFEDGKMYLIAARPAMGKSQFGLVNLGLKLQTEKPIIAFSLEMTGKGLAQRAVCNQAKINGYKLNEADLTAMEWEQFAVATTHLKDSNLLIDETPGLSTAQIRARVKAEQIKSGKIGAIIVDHVGLVKKDPRKSETEALSQISHELAAMSKEFDCPMIVLSQLNRGVESRPDKRPILADLKQTSALEEDARCVMMLYRDDYYDENTNQPNVTEVLIRKNSDGETKTCYFEHNLAMASYLPIDGYSAPQPEQPQRKF